MCKRIDYMSFIPKAATGAASSLARLARIIQQPKDADFQLMIGAGHLPRTGAKSHQFCAIGQSL
jgi:hypothetical protein